MALNIGVNVVEVDGRAAPTIVGGAHLDRRVPGAQRARSPRTSPSRVRGFADFVANFGGYTADAVRRRTRSAASSTTAASDAYVVRVVGAGARAASRDAQRPRDHPVADPRRHGRGPRPRRSRRLGQRAQRTRRGPSAAARRPCRRRSVGDRRPSRSPWPTATTVQLTVTAAAPTTVATVTFRAADFADDRCRLRPARWRPRSTARPRRCGRRSRRPGDCCSAAVPGPARACGRGCRQRPRPARLHRRPDANSDGALAAGLDDGRAVVGERVPHRLRGADRDPRARARAPARSRRPIAERRGHRGDRRRRRRRRDRRAPRRRLRAAQAAITPAEVVAAINRQAVGFSAALTHDDRLVLLSRTVRAPGRRSRSARAATPVADARAALGLATATPVAGVQRAPG